MKLIHQYVRSTLEVPHGGNATIKSMEGIRGLAVFLVFIVHYCSEIGMLFPDTGYLLVGISKIGLLGVDLFFVLSGFLIYKSMMEKEVFDMRRYALTRIRRIYPTFLFVFIIYLCISALMPAHSKLPESGVGVYILQNLLLMPGLFFIEPIMVVAWSLSYELFYYIFVPVVVFGLGLKRWAVNQRIGFWIAFSIVYVLISSDASVSPVWGQRVHLVMFIPGILIYEINKNDVFPDLGGTRYLLLAIVYFSVTSYLKMDYVVIITGLYVLLFLFCYNVISKRGENHRWFSLNPLRWFGNMSYSYYLFHGLVLKGAFLVFASVFSNELNTVVMFLALLIPVFSATVIASYFVYLLIERRYSFIQSSKNIITAPVAVNRGTK